MDKIEIKIKDNKEYGDVAFLVDKQLFLEAIERLRKKWKIKKLLLPERFDEWRIKLFELRDKEVEKKKKLTRYYDDNFDKLLKEYSKGRPDYGTLDGELAEEMRERIARTISQVDFECDVRDLRIRFNKPDTFDDAISYAIVCGVIPDGVYKSTYYSLDLSLEAPLRLQDRTSRVAIYITPQTQEKELLQVFKEAKKELLVGDKEYSPFFDLLSKDISTRIKYFRKWYWLNHPSNKDRKGYKKIANETGEIMETIRSGIRSYKLALAKY